MEYTNEEIVSALRLIKDVCNKQKGVSPCDKCPLGDEGANCMIIEDSPDTWEITEPITRILR